MFCQRRAFLSQSRSLLVGTACSASPTPRAAFRHTSTHKHTQKQTHNTQTADTHSRHKQTHTAHVGLKLLLTQVEKMAQVVVGLSGIGHSYLLPYLKRDSSCTESFMLKCIWEIRSVTSSSISSFAPSPPPARCFLARRLTKLLCSWPASIFYFYGLSVGGSWLKMKQATFTSACPTNEQRKGEC